MLEYSHKPKQQIANILTQLREKQLLIINPKRKNGLILYKPYHAEFAGPGAAIGAKFDEDVLHVLPVGILSLLIPTTSQERINGYKLRRQWVKLAQQISTHSTPQKRAQTILNQFEHWFDAETTHQLPDEAFSLLVGVLPQTINAVRHDIEWVS
ncbi:conserved hypothetical protein [Rippkaea orientalis PCC 8801]|uniref:Uncharacterized protein n=1 Tax=Rippkaea orientalis (strain PCC 8801 / RF-1) TaxID=41431 RepID=B7K3I9_RIPO1|nr:hypothetical protein [Rippkaea orientalis]ACK65331.1 conserved hypothetical protein [Rippkaea orientalis PCC 8801]